MPIDFSRKNIPNLITMARIAVIPLVVVLMMFESPVNCFWAFVIFSLAAITDWLDGYLARKWKIVSIMGQFLDPMADKLIVMATMIMLIPLDRLPAWAVFIILAREMVVTGLRSIASSEGIVISASNLGKYKTIFQMVALVALLLHYEYRWFFGVDWAIFTVNMHNVGIFFFYVSFVLTMWSGWDYLYKFSSLLTEKGKG